ncbi:MAG: RNA polymerase sigma factor [Azoarcus sp.]|nr:RNA polymerase sigma factor [Azoarcus sp.]
MASQTVVNLPAAELRRTVEAIWRIEASTLIGRVARMVRDVGLAEEFAQDALVAALEHWPRTGVPENPAAWLMTAAKRRALDHLRHHRLAAEKSVEIGRELDFHHELASELRAEQVDAGLDNTIGDRIGDDSLRLIFTACHPVLSPEARCALTLRVMGGLTTDEIARAYLKPEPTIAQRIVRAKRTLAAARVPFEIPPVAELHARLASVLEVIYLIFNEGYSATAGEDWTRPALCEEAMRLGRVLAGLMPDESEVLGLVALMEIQASRLGARVSPTGEPVLLLDQDRARWDHLLIRRGLSALDRAFERAQALPGPLGPYALQAAIAACHARSLTKEQTDWSRIAALYDALAQIAPSPVLTLNRAVAISMAYGPAAALDIVDTLVDDPVLQHYHLLPSVRGDLLCRLDRLDEARAEFERAATLTRNARERALLLARAAQCDSR